MDEWRHPLPLQLKHEEKIIGGKATKRQGIIFLVAVVLVYLSFQIPIGPALRLFRVPYATLIGFLVCGLIAFIFLVIAAIFAFVPAFRIPFFNHPKPKRNLDPYDVNMTIDQYLWFRFINKGKKPILPYRVIK